MAEDNNSNYAGNLARAIGQGITFGFGDELEARYRALTGDRSYDEEVADIRKSISEFRETNPVAAYGSEIVGSIPTGIGLAGLALRSGLKGAAKIGALEGSIYGAGEGEGVEGTATSTALGAGLGAAGGKAAEKVFEGIAPLIGKFMKKTRGSGIETKGSGNIEMDSSPSDLGPMVRDLEAGSDKFVPLEKKVGEPGTPGPDRNINPPLQEDIFVPGSDEPLGGIDYLPVAQTLLENPPGMNIGKKGLTGAQYLARLKNQPSVTDLELEVSGLDKFLAENANRKIPVDDVLDFHMGNSPRIEMVDGGYRHVADQRMFGDEATFNLATQGKNVGGGYEEVVFRDAKFASGNTDVAPGAVHSASHHRGEMGVIGHGRTTSFDDLTPGAKANSESTMLEENQSDLFEVYKGGAARAGLRIPLRRVNQNFVQLTPDKVKTFKEIEQKIEDGAQYRTLNDAFTNVDDQKRMLKEIESNQRTVTADLDGVRKRNFLSTIGPENETVSAELRFARKLDDLVRSGDESPADIMGKEMRIETELGNIVKQSVIEDTLAINRLSDDQLSKVLGLAADRSLRVGEGSSFKISPVIRNPVTDAELKEALDIPEAITGAEEDVLIGAGRLVDNVQNEFKNMFEKNTFRRELGGNNLTIQAVQTAKNLLPKAVNSIDPKLLRKDAADFRRLSSENDLFKQSIDDQNVAINKAADRVMTIYGDAIEDAAPDKKTAFEYLHYRQDQGKVGVDGERFNTLNQRFSQDPERVAERGFGDPEPEFTNPLPFKTQEQVARYQLHQMIKKAAGEGKSRFYIPDYRDLAIKRDVNVSDDKQLAPYVSRYKIPQEKVIKELKEMYPGIDIGTTDVVQPVLKDDFGNVAKRPDEIPFSEGMTREDYELRVRTQQENFKMAQPDHDFPMTYIDLTPLQAKPSQVRRYKRGGKVDMRSGIGDLFRIYS